MIVSPSPRAREIARLMELYRVSYGTAARWVDSGKQDDCIARWLNRENGFAAPTEDVRGRGEEIRAIMAKHDVSYATARRWLQAGDVEQRAAMHARGRKAGA